MVFFASSSESVLFSSFAAKSRKTRTLIKGGLKGRRHVVCAFRRGKDEDDDVTTSSKLTKATTTLCLSVAFASQVVGLGLGFFQPEFAMAIPQTSECATNACDDFDYHDQDLTQTYFTKGSLKRANFRGANLSGISLFGANLEEADFTGANLENANLGQCNLLKTNFTGANLTNAIVSGASNLETVKANDSDWSQVIIRKDVLMGICANADGVSPVSGDPTKMTLECP